MTNDAQDAQAAAGLAGGRAAEDAGTQPPVDVASYRAGYAAGIADAHSMDVEELAKLLASALANDRGPQLPAMLRKVLRSDGWTQRVMLTGTRNARDGVFLDLRLTPDGLVIGPLYVNQSWQLGPIVTWRYDAPAPSLTTLWEHGAFWVIDLGIEAEDQSPARTIAGPFDSISDARRACGDFYVDPDQERG